MKIGVIGCGEIAKHFASAANQVEGVTLGSVAARDFSRAQVFAEEFHATDAYGSYDEMLEKGDFDVIYIALINKFHYDLTKKCLLKKIPVLCEKPMSLLKNQAEELFVLAKENNTLLMEALWTKMQPAFLKAKAWIEESRIGNVKLIETSFCTKMPFDVENRYYNKELAGGALYDLGVYNIHFTCGLLGKYPEDVKGYAVIGSTGVDEWDVVSMRFPQGAMANFSCGFQAETNRVAKVYGDAGYIEVENCYGPRQCTLYSQNHEVIEQFTSEDKNGFIYQIEHFKDLFENHKLESHYVTASDTIMCAEIFDQLNEQWGI